MNCAVCGNPLLFDRVVFHCSCGAYVHAYCWNEHVLHAHTPAFEVGTADLDGDFKVKESKVEEETPEEEVTPSPEGEVITPSPEGEVITPSPEEEVTPPPEEGIITPPIE